MRSNLLLLVVAVLWLDHGLWRRLSQLCEAVLLKYQSILELSQWQTRHDARYS